MKECEGKPKVNYVTVFKRHGLDELLTQLSKFADLVLFTAGLEGYVKPLVDRIDAENRFSCRLYHHSTRIAFVEFQMVGVGNKIALVGPSGSRKSTIVSMIQRFYDTTSSIKLYPIIVGPDGWIRPSNAIFHHRFYDTMVL